MFVCCCLGVTDRAIRRAIDQGAQTLEDVSGCTGAGTRCGSCRPEIAEMVRASGTVHPAVGHPAVGDACPVRRRLPYLTAPSQDAAHASEPAQNVESAA